MTTRDRLIYGGLILVIVAGLWYIWNISR